MDEPTRIQLRRVKGWRKPPDVVTVDRGTKWGNPYRIADDPSEVDGFLVCIDADTAVRMYRHAVLYPTIGQPQVPTVDEIRTELAGKTLGCWCAPDEPCHADVLLEIANE